MLALVAALALSPLVLVVLRRLGVVDVPNGRSSHVRPTPRGGGLAPALAVVVAVLAHADLESSPRTALLVTACALGVLGLADDIWGLPALARLGLQILASAAALPWLLTDLTGPAAWRVLFAVGVLFWIVAFVNAFNFMDGIDGMAVVQTVVAGLAWFLVGRQADAPALAVGGVVVAAAALGFAPFNFPKARMFLGDVGSYFLGGALAALAVVGLRAGVPPEAVLAPLALSLADTGSTLVTRLRRHESWCTAHRDHVYQRLVQAGWSHPVTSLLAGFLMAVSSLLGAVSLTGSLPGRIVADVLLVGVLSAYVNLPARVRIEGKLVKVERMGSGPLSERGAHESRV